MTALCIIMVKDNFAGFYANNDLEEKIMSSSQPQEIFTTTVQEAGEGKPWLTLVHGFTLDQTYFAPQLEHFRKDFNLFLVDQRGHGQSPVSDGPFGLEENVDDLEAALEKAGIKATHFWGSHSGGSIGMILALRQPELVRSLVLEGPSLPGFSMPVRRSIQNRAGVLAQTRGVPYALQDWFKYADWFEYIFDHPEQTNRKAFGEMLMHFRGEPWLSELPSRPVRSVADELEKIKMPVLIFRGEEEISDYRYAMTMLLENLPQAEGVIIPQSGSFPAWENPGAVTPVIEKFLKSVS